MKSRLLRIIVSVIILLVSRNISFAHTLPVVIITEPANQTVCAGSPVSFSVTATGTGVLTYQWRKGTVNLIDTGSISGANTAILTFNPARVPDSAYDYNVVVTDLSPSSETSTNASLTVNPLPVVLTGPSDTICYGDTILIGNAPVAGNTYQWTPNSGLSAYNISNPKASPDDTTTYTLTVTNSVTGCSNSGLLLIIVKPVPSAYITAGDTANFCVGTPLILTASNGASFSWSNGSTTKSIPVVVGAVYSVGVTYLDGCTDYTGPTIVVVNPLPTANAGPAKGICRGDSTSIGTARTAQVTYNWLPATGLNYDTAAQPNASPAITTVYTLTVTDTIKGCKNTDTVTVSVYPKPAANAGTYKVICKGDSVSIGAPAIGGVTYAWLPVTGLNSSTSSQPNASPEVTTTYTLTTANGTCTNSDTVTVKVNPLPIANAGPDKTICMGDSTIIGTPAIAGNTYSWSPIAGLNSSVDAQPHASPVVPTKYILTVTNTAFSCTNADTVMVNVVPQPVANAGTYKVICKGDSAVIGAPAVNGVSYSWLPTGGLNSATASQPNASPAGTTTYTLTATNGICSNTDTVTVKVNPLPIANAGPDKNICMGDSTSIGTPALPGNTYSWSPAAGLNSSTDAQPNASPSVPTTYIVTVTNTAFSCTNTDTVFVNVAPAPIANTGPNKSICIGDSTSIGAPAVAGITYAWLPAAGLSSATSSQPNASPAGSITYTLTVTGGICNTIGTGTVLVTVNNLPIANAGPDRVICKGDTTTIGTPALAGFTYSWSPANGLNSVNDAQPNASPALSTSYIVMVTNGGCSNTDTVMVTVNPLPAANTGTGQFLCGAGDIVLGAPAVIGDIYVWSPATGLNSTTIAQPTATPGATILYSLYEKDTTTGCFMTNQVQIIVETNNEFYTGISPNGDGVNDWWNIPMLNCYPSNTVLITNRWGSEVWNGTNYDNVNVRWAGQDMNGTDLADGTYYYIIRYNNTEKRGWVFIKR